MRSSESRWCVACALDQSTHEHQHGQPNAASHRFFICATDFSAMRDLCSRTALWVKSQKTSRRKILWSGAQTAASW